MINESNKYQKKKKRFVNELRMQLLGLLGRLKGITTELVASQCVKKLYESGDIHMINASDSEQLSQFAAHFIGLTNQPQTCNFASFVPSGETTPLQVTHYFYGSNCSFSYQVNFFFLNARLDIRVSVLKVLFINQIVKPLFNSNVSSLSMYI